MAYRYQQPPYQTTVMQPAVVVQPVVVPLYSGPRFMMNQGPAYLQSGVNLGSFFVPGACVLVMGFLGGGLLLMSLIIFATTSWDMEFWRKFNMTMPPTVIPAIVIGTIGLIFSIISCHLCQTAKKNFGTGTGNTSGHVYSRHGEPGFGQPDTAADPGNTSGHVYSREGQPAVGKPITAIAAPAYMPVQPVVLGGAMYPQQGNSMVVQSGGVIYPQQGIAVQPGGFTGPMYPEGSTVTTVSYGNTAPINQPPQPGYPNAPGQMPYAAVPPPYSGPENSFPPPEYEKQPAFAPPSYNP